MGKEGSLQVPRRTTRALAAAVATDAVEATPRKCSRVPPTISDLVFGGEPVSLDDLLSRFPGRHVQILELVNSLGPANSPMLPLLIYGCASTGKTSIVLEIFRHLKRPFVYSSCRTCYNPRILYESVLNQLLLHVRTASNGYSSAKRCDKPSDFVNFARDALVNIITDLKGCHGKINSKKSASQINGSMVYLVFDNLELVQDWDKGSNLLAFLFNLYDTLKIPEVGLIFISSAAPDSYYSKFRSPEPIPVYFPDYAEDELRQIFLKNQVNKKLYSSFLDAALQPFCRMTRQVDELSVALSPLFEKYCEPLTDKEVVPNKDMKQRLLIPLKPHISSYLNETFRTPMKTCANKPNRDTSKGNSSRKSGICEDNDELDFHMSTTAKYLLISAFLTSRNPATLDATMFDSTGGYDNRKRKRKPSEKSKEQKETAEQELLMKGPGTFPLERLLAIFQSLTSVDFSMDEEQESNDSGAESGARGLMSDVLLQLSSLCDANFIVKGVSCPLEGSTRYRCTVDENMALKIARSLKFPLTRYLYRG